MDKTGFQWALEPLRKFATFSGRASRAEYWWFYLLTIVVQVPTNIIDRVTHTAFAGGAVALALLLPAVAVAVRRFHDSERSGWWLLLPLAGGAIMAAGFGFAMARRGMVYPGLTGIPLLVVWFGGLVLVGAALIQLIWLIARGTDGPNRFGADPLDRGGDVAEVFA